MPAVTTRLICHVVTLPDGTTEEKTYPKGTVIHDDDEHAELQKNHPHGLVRVGHGPSHCDDACGHVKSKAQPAKSPPPLSPPMPLVNVPPANEVKS
jgi:hypothetical protein